MTSEADGYGSGRRKILRTCVRGTTVDDRSKEAIWRCTDHRKPDEPSRTNSDLSLLSMKQGEYEEKSCQTEWQCSYHDSCRRLITVRNSLKRQKIPEGNYVNSKKIWRHICSQ